MTTTQAAEQLGCDRATVARICKRHNIGELVTPRCRTLTAADLEQVRKHYKGSPGNPNFGPDFHKAGSVD